MQTDYSKLTIANDFMFGKVMQNNEDITKELIQRIFPDFKILRVDYLQTQETVDNYIDAKSIRLDLIVMVNDKQQVYNLEMQTSNKRDLRKRGRYYVAQIDIGLIQKGEKYTKLPKAFVIFICTFDPFKRGRHIYSFPRICREDKNLELKDSTEIIFLSTKGTMDDCSAEVKSFLDYVETGQPNDDPFTQQLDTAVEEARRNSDWGREYMKLLVLREDAYDDGFADGEVKGKAEGLAEGLAEGMAKKADEMIRSFLSQGFPLEAIAKASGMSLDYIQNFGV